MGASLELRSFLERHWRAQCQLVGKETLARLLTETEKGNTKVDSWAIEKTGGTPLDVGIALSGLSAGIAFLQLVFQAYDLLAKRQKPNAAELKAEVSKMITTPNSPEEKVLNSERGEKIIDELTR
jgi:hypothetical protein